MTVPSIQTALPFWRDSKAEISDRIAATQSTLKIVLKTKNDPYFLERWIAHHAGIVGLENLVIFDNGSSHPAVHEVYGRYRAQVPIIQFDGFFNLLHDSRVFPELYEGLKASAEFFVFLDTDEFLVRITGDTYSRSGDILDYLSSHSQAAVFPGTWLPNVRGCSRRFRMGSSVADLSLRLTWGKPIFRADAYRPGTHTQWVHNVDVPGDLFRGRIWPQCFVLHLKNLSSQQRIDININKLIGSGAVSPEHTLESLLRRDPDSFPVGDTRRLVGEIRHLITRTTAPIHQDVSDGGWISLAGDGSVRYSGTAQSNAMHDYLTGSQRFCRAVLQTERADLLADQDEHLRKWRALATPRSNRQGRRERPKTRRTPIRRRTSAPVCIAGMHRSGTSMIARILNLGGLYLGEPWELEGSIAYNADGLWEHRTFVKLNDELLSEYGGGWDHPTTVSRRIANSTRLRPIRNTATRLLGEFLGHEPWGWKDPRNSLTLPFWQTVAGRLKVVLCVRNPLDVVLSLRARNSFSDSLSLSLWKEYNERVLGATRSTDRLVTHYDAYFDNPSAEIRRVLEFAGLNTSTASVDACSAAIADRLRHHNSTAHLLAAELAPDIVDLYRRLLIEGHRTRDAEGLAQRARRSRAHDSKGSRRSTRPQRQVNPVAVDLMVECANLRSALLMKDHAIDALGQELEAARAGRDCLEGERAALQQQLDTLRQYEELKRRLYDLLDETIPRGASVLIVSRDHALVQLNDRKVGPFPRTADGVWNGHPANGRDVIEQLETIRAGGSAYLVLPQPAKWWLDHYADLATYLHERGRTVVDQEHTAIVFELPRSISRP